MSVKLTTINITGQNNYVIKVDPPPSVLSLWGENQSGIVPTLMKFCNPKSVSKLAQLNKKWRRIVSTFLRNPSRQFALNFAIKCLSAHSRFSNISPTREVFRNSRLTDANAEKLGCVVQMNRENKLLIRKIDAGILIHEDNDIITRKFLDKEGHCKQLALYDKESGRLLRKIPYSSSEKDFFSFRLDNISSDLVIIDGKGNIDMIQKDQTKRIFQQEGTVVQKAAFIAKKLFYYGYQYNGKSICTYFLKSYALYSNLDNVHTVCVSHIPFLFHGTDDRIVAVFESMITCFAIDGMNKLWEKTRKSADNLSNQNKSQGLLSENQKFLLITSSNAGARVCNLLTGSIVTLRESDSLKEPLYFWNNYFVLHALPKDGRVQYILWDSLTGKKVELRKRNAENRGVSLHKISTRPIFAATDKDPRRITLCKPLPGTGGILTKIESEVVRQIMPDCVRDYFTCFQCCYSLETFTDEQYLVTHPL